MKKIVILLLVLIFTICFYLYTNTTKFIYVNPYTNTEVFEYLSPTLKSLNQIYAKIQKNCEKDNCKFKYIFYNAYGSGFIKGNSIPNDLDLSVAINLGEYSLDKDTKEKIANDILEKMFKYYCHAVFELNNASDFYASKNLMEMLKTKQADFLDRKRNIIKNLDNALSGKEYMNIAHKAYDDGTEIIHIDVPYLMKSNELLLEEMQPIEAWSSTLKYNNSMANYIREVSIIPEFYVTIVKNNKKTVVELVPESYLGARLQLSRRFFASNTFFNISSKDFINKISYFKNDDEYLFYRLYTFRRHLLDIENCEFIKTRPVKIFKRIQQTADSIYPLLSEKIYKEISDFVSTNLGKKEIVLLNEYGTVYKNILTIMESPSLYFKLQEEGQLENMCKVMQYTSKEMEQTKISRNTIQTLQEFVNKDLKKAISIHNSSELEAYRLNFLKKRIESIGMLIADEILKCADNSEKINKYIQMFQTVLTDAGFHKAYIYCIDENTNGIVKDEFTSQIKDLKAFAKENKLPDTNYVYIDKNNIKLKQMEYYIWSRYNSTQKEDENYKRLKTLLINDKKNFNATTKYVFPWQEK